MQNLLNFIEPYILPLEVIALVLSIVFILMQNRGASLSSSFGGGNEVYLTRRGIEKWVVNITVVCISIFVILRILTLYT